MTSTIPSSTLTWMHSTLLLRFVIIPSGLSLFAHFVCILQRLFPPRLAGLPLGIGGNSMLCTASYEARKYGVRSAMPGFIAKKLYES